MGNRCRTTALEVRTLVDESIEKILIYSSNSAEPNHAAVLGVVVADLKQIKRLLVALEKAKPARRLTSLEMCNQLFLRIVKRLHKCHRLFPFSIYSFQLIQMTKENYLWILDKQSKCFELLLRSSRRILPSELIYPLITFILSRRAKETPALLF